MSDQLLDPDVPTLASQDKLKVSPKGLPFVIINARPKTLLFTFVTELLESISNAFTHRSASLITECGIKGSKKSRERVGAPNSVRSRVLTILGCTQLDSIIPVSE